MVKHANIILELTVNNHAGVMSHITGLFSRRGFNLEGILCSPISDGKHSRMFLMVNPDERVDRIMKQLENLHDVVEVWARQDCDNTLSDLIHDLTAELHMKPPAK